jgi:hypothetical protein
MGRPKGDLVLILEDDPELAELLGVMLHEEIYDLRSAVPCPACGWPCGGALTTG